MTTTINQRSSIALHAANVQAIITIPADELFEPKILIQTSGLFDPETDLCILNAFTKAEYPPFET
jgi:hypothetical protein